MRSIIICLIMIIILLSYTCIQKLDTILDINYRQYYYDTYMFSENFKKNGYIGIYNNYIFQYMRHI